MLEALGEFKDQQIEFMPFMGMSSARQWLGLTVVRINPSAGIEFEMCKSSL
jgi:hypothetical protein